MTTTPHLTIVLVCYQAATHNGAIGNFVQTLQKLRTLAKNIGPLYWLVGLMRYVAFAGRLRNETRKHASGNSALPPPMLRYRVQRLLDEESYVIVGKLIAKTIFDIAFERGVIWNGLAVLDFACGPGRVATELKKLGPTCNFRGSDIDREAVVWAQGHLSHVGVFQTNAAMPPTGFLDDQFDVIYCISLFTHLDEETQDSWLEELARVLKPGGTFIATVHGRFATQSCTSDELRQLKVNGIAYRVDRRGRFKLDGLPDFYQTTFHTRDYIGRRWGLVFDIVDYMEGGLGGHQDVVVMRRKGQR